jgi:predicted house-cleaning noncanonical NTP pyrophosphatase (MazG superfamily)
MKAQTERLARIEERVGTARGPSFNHMTDEEISEYIEKALTEDLEEMIGRKATSHERNAYQELCLKHAEAGTLEQYWEDIRRKRAERRKPGGGKVHLQAQDLLALPESANVSGPISHCTGAVVGLTAGLEERK